MLWLVADLTVVSPCLGVSLLLIMNQCSQDSLVCTSTSKYTIPFRRTVHELPIGYVFKPALLVQSGYLKYCKPFLKHRHSVYSSQRSQVDGVILDVYIDFPSTEFPPPPPPPLIVSFFPTNVLFSLYDTVIPPPPPPPPRHILTEFWLSSK